MRILWAAMAIGWVAMAIGLSVPLMPRPAAAETGGGSADATPLRIGFLTDLNGPHTANDGKASIDAARMAIEDFGGTVLGRPVELVVGDHQNKADIGSAIARRWIDSEHVEVVMDLNNSAVALAVSTITRELKKVTLVTSAASSDLTGKSCSPYLVHWLPDTYTLAHNIALAVTDAENDSWFFITADYAFGHSLQAEAEKSVLAKGGKVLGSVRHPIGSPDFSSYLLQAQQSGAKVIGFANAAQDLINALKQKNEFQITARAAAMAVYLLDIPAVGQKQMAGLLLLDAFYWDMNDQSRVWSKRFLARNGQMPTTPQADAYHAVMHYLQAVQAAGTIDGDAVMRKMKELPIDDATGTTGFIREDGRVIRDMRLYTVKPPEETKYDWDLLTELKLIPGAEAYRPLSAGGCQFVTH